MSLFQAMATAAIWVVHPLLLSMALILRVPPPSSVLPPLPSEDQLFHLLKDCSRRVALNSWCTGPLGVPAWTRTTLVTCGELLQLHALQEVQGPTGISNLGRPCPVAIGGLAPPLPLYSAPSPSALSAIPTQTVRSCPQAVVPQPLASRRGSVNIGCLCLDAQWGQSTVLGPQELKDD